MCHCHNRWSVGIPRNPGFEGYAKQIPSSAVASQAALLGVIAMRIAEQKAQLSITNCELTNPWSRHR
jgi:hypothetical protein